MGRMLEALKLTGPERRRPAEPPLVLCPVPADLEETEPPEPEDEIPFIEVGGPKKTIQGSRDVLSSPPPPPQPAAPVTKITASPPSTAIHSGQAAGPWMVRFRPSSPTRGAPCPAPELIAFHQPEHAVSVEYRTILGALAARLPAVPCRVLLFTSPGPWNGTTTVLLNVALTAARQEGRRVLAVDGNLHRPAIAERLGVSGTPGLREVLAGKVSLDAAIRDTPQPGLRVLPAGQAGSASPAGLPGHALLGTIRQLREQFDLVLVDAPSWDEGSEVAVLAAACDAVFMVMHQAKGDETAAADPLPLLRQPPANLCGWLVTSK